MRRSESSKESNAPPKKRPLAEFSNTLSDEDESESRPSFGLQGNNAEIESRPSFCLGLQSNNDEVESRPMFGLGLQGNNDEVESRPMFGLGLQGNNAETDPGTMDDPPAEDNEDPAKAFLIQNNQAPVYNDIAAKMMAKMGYQKGKGLGKHGQGRVNIIEASAQRGRRGLGLTIKAFEPSDVSWDCEREIISAEQHIEWMKPCNKETPDLDTLRTWSSEGPKVHNRDDDYEFCSAKLVDDVFKCKSLFDDLEPEEMRRARTRSNPYETIRGGIFLNRAAMKMANLDAVANFMFTDPKVNGKSLVEPNELFYFADVCAGPGGFSEYVLWRKKSSAKGFGFTLKGPQDFRLEDFFAASSEYFEPHYGVGGYNGDGDVYRPDNLAEFRKFVMENTHQKGLHLFMADGGFDVVGRENDQEWLSKRIYLCECIAALSILREGGNFVCKLFDVFLTFSVGLLYLLYLAFDEIAIFKPVTSRPANSERYIIGKGRKASADRICDYLIEVNKQFEKLGSHSDRDINDIVPLNVLTSEPEFVEYIITSNERLGVAQAISLSKIKAFAQNSVLYENRQAEMREECLKLWKVPSHARVAPNKSIKAIDKFMELVPKQDAGNFKLAAEPLTPSNLELVKSVFDYRCFLGSTEKRFFLLGLGKSYVYQWDGQANTRWQQVNNVKIELPADTLIEAEFVQELKGEGRGQRRLWAVHCIDAYVLGGVSVQDLHYNERLEKLRLFVEAITRPTRSELATIRVKEVHRLEDMHLFSDRLDYRIVKGGGGQKRICYCPDGGGDYVPGGIYLVKYTKEPWMMAWSKSQQHKYYYNTATRQSLFETPKEAIGSFTNCHSNQLYWCWEPGVKVLENQPVDEDPTKLSLNAVLNFIKSKLPA